MSTKSESGWPASGYRVMVDDNFDFMDDDERYCAGSFASYSEAVAAARRIVEKEFQNEDGTRKTGTPEELYDQYTSFGDDPFIVPFGGAPQMPRFSAWDYAKQLAGLTEDNSSDKGMDNEGAG